MTTQTDSNGTSASTQANTPAANTAKAPEKTVITVMVNGKAVEVPERAIFIAKTRNYRYPTRFGDRIVDVKFQGNRLDLSPLANPEDRAVYAALRNSTRLGMDFEEMQAGLRAQDDLESKARTLKQLQGMSTADMLLMFKPGELTQLGLPAHANDKELLIVAILFGRKAA